MVEIIETPGMLGLTQIEHIGIAVVNIKEANQRYTQLLGVPPYKQEEVPTQKVMTSFFKAGSQKIELVAATEPTSPIALYLQKHREGIHHIAFLVPSIIQEIQRLQPQGFRFLTERPQLGADHKNVIFIHPKDNHGVLVELCEEQRTI